MGDTATETVSEVISLHLRSWLKHNDEASAMLRAKVKMCIGDAGDCFAA